MIVKKEEPISDEGEEEEMSDAWRRLVGWLVRRFTGPVVPFSEQGRSVALLTGLAIRHLSTKKLSALFFTKSPTESYLERWP